MHCRKCYTNNITKYETCWNKKMINVVFYINLEKQILARIFEI